MHDQSWLGPVVAIAILNLILFYMIIRSAVSGGAATDQRMKHAWAQTALLIEIARRQGVDPATLQAITNKVQS